MDINTLVTFTEDKKEDFSNNQTVRVLDQIGNDIASCSIQSTWASCQMMTRAG